MSCLINGRSRERSRGPEGRGWWEWVEHWFGEDGQDENRKLREGISVETNPLALREGRRRTGKNPEEERQEISWEREKGKTFSEVF